MNWLRPQGGGRKGAAELRKTIAEAHHRHIFQSARRLSPLKSDSLHRTCICASVHVVAELLAKAASPYGELPGQNKNMGIGEEDAN